jgi:4-hydroxysphinganine ceramide fatty acyl 2-hydroxylase
VTSFLEDHPGGDDLILDHAGKDMNELMKDPSSHDHSNSAYEMLNDFRIGELGGVTSVSDGECN